MSGRKRKGGANRSLQNPQAKTNRDHPSHFWGIALVTVVGVIAILGLLGQFSPPDGGVPAAPDPSSQPLSTKSDTPPPPDITPPPETVEQAEEEALKTATALVQHYDRNPEAWSVLGQLHVKLSDAAEAEKCWLQCLALQPDFVKAHLGLAAAAEAKADNEVAIAALQEARKIDASSPVVGRRLAKLLIQQAETEQAVTLLQQNIRLNSRSYEDWSLLGEAYTQAKDFRRAKECLEKALAIDAARPEAHYMLARACARLGFRDLATEHQQEFAKLQAAREEDRRQNNLARTDLGEMCETAALAYLGAGDVYASQGDLAEAERHWVRGATIDPRITEVRQRLASFYLQTGRFDDAVRVHKELVEIEPQNVLNYVNLGTVLANNRQIHAAEEAFAEAVRLAPDKAIGYTCLAKLFMQSGRNISVAWEHAQKAVRLEPTAINYALLAAVSEANGDLRGAGDAARHAVELEPDNPRYVDLYRRFDK